MQAVDGGLRFCVAGELDEGAACVHRKRETERRGTPSGKGLECGEKTPFITVVFMLSAL